MLDLINAQGSSMAMTRSAGNPCAGFGPAALSQFREAIVAAGLTPPGVIEAAPTVSIKRSPNENRSGCRFGPVPGPPCRGLFRDTPLLFSHLYGA